jgi:hypothetical protein
MAASVSLLNLHNAIEIVNPCSIQSYLILYSVILACPESF